MVLLLEIQHIARETISEYTQQPHYLQKTGHHHTTYIDSGSHGKRLWMPNSGQSIFWCDWSHFGLVPCKDSSATSLCVWINLSYQSFVTCRYRSCGRYGNWQADTLSPCNYHLLALIFRISHKNLTLILMRIYSFLLKISLNLGAWIVICQNNRMFACL